MELNQFRDVDLVIDKANDNFIQRQFVSQGDYKGRTMTVQVTDNGIIGKVPGLMLNLRWRNQASGLADLSAFECIDDGNSVFRIEYPEQMMTPGKVVANIQVIQNGQATHLKTFEMTVQALAGEMTGIVDKAEYGALVAVLANANKFRTDIDDLYNTKAGKDEINGKADKEWVESTFAAIQKQFTATYPTLEALKNEYPKGTSGTFLVLKDNGLYQYLSGKWTKVDTYKDIEDEIYNYNSLIAPSNLKKRQDIPDGVGSGNAILSIVNKNDEKRIQVDLESEEKSFKYVSFVVDGREKNINFTGKKLNFACRLFSESTQILKIGLRLLENPDDLSKAEFKHFKQITLEENSNQLINVDFFVPQDQKFQYEYFEVCIESVSDIKIPFYVDDYSLKTANYVSESSSIISKKSKINLGQSVSIETVDRMNDSVVYLKSASPSEVYWSFSYKDSSGIYPTFFDISPMEFTINLANMESDARKYSLFYDVVSLNGDILTTTKIRDFFVSDKKPIEVTGLFTLTPKPNGNEIRIRLVSEKPFSLAISDVNLKMLPKKRDVNNLIGDMYSNYRNNQLTVDSVIITPKILDGVWALTLSDTLKSDNAYFGLYYTLYTKKPMKIKLLTEYNVRKPLEVVAHYVDASGTVVKKESLFKSTSHVNQMMAKELIFKPDTQIDYEELRLNIGSYQNGTDIPLLKIFNFEAVLFDDLDTSSNTLIGDPYLNIQTSNYGTVEKEKVGDKVYISYTGTNSDIASGIASIFNLNKYVDISTLKRRKIKVKFYFISNVSGNLRPILANYDAGGAQLDFYIQKTFNVKAGKINCIDLIIDTNKLMGLDSTSNLNLILRLTDEKTATLNQKIYFEEVSVVDYDDVKTEELEYQMKSKGYNGRQTIINQFELYLQRWIMKNGMTINGVEKTYEELYDWFLNKNNAKYRGALKMKNNRLVDKDDKPIEMIGIGTHHLITFDAMTSYDNLELYKYLGVNTIRITVYLSDAFYGKMYNNRSHNWFTNEAEIKKKVEQVVDDCIELGLYCVIDYHNLEMDGDVNQYLSNALEFFDYFGQKYGNVPNVLWQILNEPFSNTYASITNFMTQVKSKILEYNSNPVMIVGTTSDSITDQYSAMVANGDDDIFIDVHTYVASDANYISRVVTNFDNGLPVLLFEWGNADWGGDTLYNDERAKDLLAKCHEKCIPQSIWKAVPQESLSSLFEYSDFNYQGGLKYGFGNGDLSHNGQLYFDWFRHIMFVDWIERESI